LVHAVSRGYNIAKIPLERAAENAQQAGVRNIELHDASVDPIPEDASFDFITTFDCLHDMTRPDLVMRAIRNAIKPDGTWLIADVHGMPTFEQNLKDNHLAPVMYGFSVLCYMSSALSEPGGLGLGTLGFPEPVARRMTMEAGFTRFTPKDFENPINSDRLFNSELHVTYLGFELDHPVHQTKGPRNPVSEAPIRTGGEIRSLRPLAVATNRSMHHVLVYASSRTHRYRGGNSPRHYRSGRPFVCGHGRSLASICGQFFGGSHGPGASFC
jgi:hypothetical protein